MPPKYSLLTKCSLQSPFLYLVYYLQPSDFLEQISVCGKTKKVICIRIKVILGRIYFQLCRLRNFLMNSHTWIDAVKLPAPAHPLTGYKNSSSQNLVSDWLIWWQETDTVFWLVDSKSMKRKKNLKELHYWVQGPFCLCLRVVLMSPRLNIVPNK